MRPDLEGTKEEPVVAAVTTHGIAIDAPGGKLYWTGDGVISRANLDGSSVETFAKTSAFAVAILRPVGNVPAVSDVGLAVLVALLLVGGGLIIARRQRAEAA